MPAGLLGGFWEALGGKGAASVFGGVVIDAVIHGWAASKIAEYFSKKSGKTIEEEYDKADLVTSGIIAIPAIAFGVLRTTKYTYESDVLDFIGNITGGAMAYEVGNVVEILMAAIEAM